MVEIKHYKELLDAGYPVDELMPLFGEVPEAIGACDGDDVIALLLNLELAKADLLAENQRLVNFQRYAGPLLAKVKRTSALARRNFPKERIMLEEMFSQFYSDLHLAAQAAKCNLIWE